MARATLKQQRANKDYICPVEGNHPIVKGSQYWSLTAFRRQARYCLEHKPSDEVVHHFAPQSRADRASEVADSLRAAAQDMHDVAERIRAYLDLDDASEKDIEAIHHGFDTMSEPDLSDVEDLASEMGDWRDNMSGTGLENTSKYEEVEAAADALESIDTSPDIPSWPEDETDENLSDLANELEEGADELDGIADELEGIDFPGMY